MFRTLIGPSTDITFTEHSEHIFTTVPFTLAYHFHSANWVAVWSTGLLNKPRSHKLWWRGSLSSGEHWWEIFWSSKKVWSLGTTRNDNSTRWCCKASVQNVRNTRTDLRKSPVDIASWSQISSDCLRASFWLSNDHEEFNQAAMNKHCARTQVLTQSVQRQVQTLIELKDAYKMQVLQDWRTFRWSRITLLSDPAATMIRMKVHVFLRLYTVCWSLESRPIQQLGSNTK